MKYTTNENIPSLDEVRRKEREEKEKIRNKKTKNFLLKAITYYNENYPNSTHENIWKAEKVEIKIGHESLLEELRKLSEKELQAIFEVLTYFHDERQMALIEEHNMSAKIRMFVKKILPGGHILENLYKLYEERKKINNKIEHLEDRLNIERKEFEENLEKIKNISEQFICNVEGCGFVAKSASGLSSHMRKHEKERFM